MSRREMLAHVAKHWPAHVLLTGNQVGNVWTLTIQHSDGGPVKQVKVYRRRGLTYSETLRVWRSACASESLRS